MKRIYKINELYDEGNNEKVIKELMIDKYNGPLDVEFDEFGGTINNIRIYPFFDVVKNNNEYNFFISYKDTNTKTLFSFDITPTYNKLYKSERIKLNIDGINKIKRVLDTISTYVKGNIDNDLYNELYKCNTFDKVLYRYQHTNWS